MADTSSVWQSRANVPQGDPNAIHLQKELHDHGQAIAELTTTMNQLAKAQLQQVQGSKQVNVMEGVNMMMNKRWQKGQQGQSHPKQFMQDDSGYDQGDSYNEQEEEGELPSDTVVNPKGGNNRGHAMAMTTRSGKGGDATTSNQRRIVDDDVVVQEDKIPSNVVEANDEVRIDIDENVEETQEEMTHQVSAIVHSMAPKLEDPGAFIILCTIGSADFAKALCDLGVSINLMPYSMFKTLGIGKPRPTSMSLQMADQIMKRPLGIIDDVLVRVDTFILPADFVILDCEVDYEVPIILGIHFLATGKALVDVEVYELTFCVGDEKVVFHVCKSMRQPNNNKVCSFVDLVTEVIVDDTSATMNIEYNLEVILLNLDDDEEKEGYAECVNALQGMGSYTYEPRKLSLDLENRKTPPTNPSIEEPPTLELKPLPPHLRYKFLGPSSTLLVIISSCLTNMQVESILEVLQKRKRAIGWTLADNRGISPTFCMHKMILEEGPKPSVEYQRRLNKAMQEVVKKEIIKWLAGRAFYYFLDGYSGYNQILIAPDDQENTTFTCPYSTFAFSRMPFGLELDV
ncbi:uncharacterized protein [Nicotiana tomentosiformis]|uniref:uncharacterized protein n=1 Tax=Nicotiana tomentosiformis TaxID=4098 RepID=UPI00388C73BE